MASSSIIDGKSTSELGLEAFVTVTEISRRGVFLSSMFYKFNGDNAFSGYLTGDSRKFREEEITKALQRVPDHEVFIGLPENSELTCPSTSFLPMDKIFIKRPNLIWYIKGLEDPERLKGSLYQQALILEHIKSQPHKNIMKYHGVHVVDKLIKGLILERCKYTLAQLVLENLPFNENEVIEGLTAAISHLHKLGYAHNNLSPNTVMIGESGLPVLVGFGLCNRIGNQILLNGMRGSPKGAVMFSSKENDYRQVEKIKNFLREPNKDEN